MKHCFICHAVLPFGSAHYHTNIRVQVKACEGCLKFRLASVTVDRSGDLDFGEADDRLLRQAERYTASMEARA